MVEGSEKKLNKRPNNLRKDATFCRGCHIVEVLGSEKKHQGRKRQRGESPTDGKRCFIGCGVYREMEIKKLQGEVNSNERVG